MTLTDDADTLRGYGLEVSLQDDPLAWLVAIPDSRPDVVILPLQLRSVQVDALIRTICDASKTRCFVVWGPGEEAADRMETCLDAGASGLLPPRLSGRELAQVLSVAGIHRERSPLLRAGSISLDLDGLTVHHARSRSQLTPVLAALLEALVRAHPDPVDQEDLVERLGLRNTLTLRQTIVRLRKRLRGIGVPGNPVAYSREGRYRLALTDPAGSDAGRSAHADHAPAP
ncbi:MAG: hypothetical protein WCA30_11650 [Dermatophilaceae bacterium]